MPDQQPLPETPRPKDGGNARITDYFQSIERTDNGKKSKRELDDEEDAQPAKKPKISDNHPTDSPKKTRYHIHVNAPKQKRKTPTSARLLDDTDGGLCDSLVGRRDFVKEESVEGDDAGDGKHPKLSAPIRAPVNVVKSKRKKPASSRLLDEADGGLLESLVGRFETPRYEEEVAEHQEEKGNDNSMHGAVDDNNMDDNTLDDDSEAETIRADESEDNMSSDENRDDEDGEEDSDEGEDSEGDDSDKENVDPRDRSRAPSPPSLPTTPGHHGNQSHDTAESTPRASNQPSASSSSFLLPSPVVDLPPLPSSPSSSSTLVPEPPSTLPSPSSSP